MANNPYLMVRSRSEYWLYTILQKKWWDRHKGHGSDRTPLPVWPNVRQKKKFSPTLRNIYKKQHGEQSVSNGPITFRILYINVSFRFTYIFFISVKNMNLLSSSIYRHIKTYLIKHKQSLILRPWVRQNPTSCLTQCQTEKKVFANSA
jgi:hypothetical protein